MDLALYNLCRQCCISRVLETELMLPLFSFAHAQYISEDEKAEYIQKLRKKALSGM